MTNERDQIQLDQEADVLYVSLGRSEHVTGVELADNLLLRLDTGKATEGPPRAVGLTFISFARMMEYHRDRPLTVSLEALRNLPEDLWLAVMAVLTSPPVSDFLSFGQTGLSVGLAIAPLSLAKAHLAHVEVIRLDEMPRATTGSPCSK